MEHDKNKLLEDAYEQIEELEYEKEQLLNILASCNAEYRELKSKESLWKTTVNI